MQSEKCCPFGQQRRKEEGEKIDHFTGLPEGVRRNTGLCGIGITYGRACNGTGEERHFLEHKAPRTNAHPVPSGRTCSAACPVLRLLLRDREGRGAFLRGRGRLCERADALQAWPPCSVQARRFRYGHCGRGASHGEGERDLQEYPCVLQAPTDLRFHCDAPAGRWCPP